MKAKLNFNTLITKLFIAAIFILGSSELVAQKKNPLGLKDFKILIVNTENGIKMQSFSGSSWIHLSFSLSTSQSQAIDEWGMTKLNNVSPNKNPNLADYLFTISKTPNGVELKGIEGTYWTKLTFSLEENVKQGIDQNGMTSLK